MMMTASPFYGHMNMSDKLTKYMYGLDYPSNPDAVIVKQEKSMEPHVTVAGGLSSLAPEMESTFISAPPLSTSCDTPTSTRFLSQPVTTEQELYAQGFLDALKQIQTRTEQDKQPQLMSSAYQSNPSLGNVANTYVTATTSAIPSHLQERSMYSTPAESNASSPYSSREDLRVIHPYHMGSPASLTCSPATSESDIYDKLNGPMAHHDMFRDAMAVVPDMKTQEQLKSERKKARNRIAASKCRQKRLAREATLQDKVTQLKVQHNELQSERVNLKESIAELKKQLSDHLRKGCHIDLPHIVNSKNTKRSMS